MDLPAEEIYRRFGSEHPYWTGPSAYDFLKELAKEGEEHSVSGSWLRGLMVEGDKLQQRGEALAEDEGPCTFVSVKPRKPSGIKVRLRLSSTVMGAGLVSVFFCGFDHFPK
jgi:hypothetical protein